MSAQSLNCPNCGAPLNNPLNQGAVICDHCGSLVAIQLPSPPAPASPPAARERPPYGTNLPDPTFQYGPAPSAQPERSALTSLTLGPADARHIVELLRDHQQLTAIQFYQSKVGGSLGDAKAAVEAIEAGLRDAAAPRAPSAAGFNPADLPAVRDRLAAGDKIGAIKAYRLASGSALREAAAAIDGLERQLYPDRARPTALARPAASGWAGCLSVGLGIVILLMCIFGGCGAYVQTQAIYRCSMQAVKAAVVQKRILTPPVEGGYLVLVPGYHGQGGFSDWYMNAEYFAPVWGANGFGIVDAHIAADSTGWNNVSAKIFKGGKFIQLLPPNQIECGN